eukprot:6917388-Karenia_brevis.AAC.1
MMSVSIVAPIAQHWIHTPSSSMSVKSHLSSPGEGMLCIADTCSTMPAKDPRHGAGNAGPTLM